MKKIALSLLVALSSITAYATDRTTLYVTFNDGEQLEFALADSPEVTVGDNKMNIKTATTNYTCELWTVKNFRYTKEAAGISNVENKPTYTLEGNDLIVDGTANKINIYRIDGEKINLPYTTESGKTVINLDSLKGGVFLVKINGKVIKIARS